MILAACFASFPACDGRARLPCIWNSSSKTSGRLAQTFESAKHLDGYIGYVVGVVVYLRPEGVRQIGREQPGAVQVALRARMRCWSVRLGW